MRRSRKGRRGTKRADLSTIREAIKDQREFFVKGLVLADDSGGPHFEVIEGDVIVDVLVVPMEIEISAVVSSPVGGLGTGIYSIPPVGAEVVVGIPDGYLDFEPTVVGVCSSQGAPSGLVANTIVVVAPEGGEVLIHDGDSGEARELAYRSDVEALTDVFNAHIHQDATTAPTTVPVGASSVQLVKPAAVMPVTPFDVYSPGAPQAAPAPEGTSVLKGK